MKLENGDVYSRAAYENVEREIDSTAPLEDDGDPLRHEKAVQRNYLIPRKEALYAEAWDQAIDEDILRSKAKALQIDATHGLFAKNNHAPLVTKVDYGASFGEKVRGNFKQLFEKVKETMRLFFVRGVSKKEMPIASGGVEQSSVSYEVIETIIGKLSQYGKIIESKKNGAPVVIALPHIHNLNYLKYSPEQKHDTTIIEGQVLDLRTEIVLGGASTSVMIEGDVFDTEGIDIHGKYKMYGAESKENHSVSIKWVEFTSFFRNYFSDRRNRDTLIGKLKKDEKIGSFLLKEFAVDLGEEDPQSIIVSLDKAGEIVDSFFDAPEKVDPSVYTECSQEIRSELDKIAIIERNICIVENIQKLFLMNDGQPVILEMGRGHFLDETSPSGIPVNKLQDLFNQADFSYFIVAVPELQTL